eukprot:3350405-Prymnesium_polylepis.1
MVCATSNVVSPRRNRFARSDSRCASSDAIDRLTKVSQKVYETPELSPGFEASRLVEAASRP